jgi:hypothetical protein
MDYSFYMKGFLNCKKYNEEHVCLQAMWMWNALGLHKH